MSDALTCLFPVSWASDPENGYGECHVTVIYDDDGRLASVRIDEAAPRILLADAVRYQFREENVRLAVGGQFVSLTDDVLRIVGENRTVVYRLGEYLPHLRCCVAEWPD